MAKATTIKEAITRLEEKCHEKASEAKEVKLNAQKLSLSTNCIEKIANLNGLKCLTILSLGRNNIKSLTGLEAVSETLEQLWISYNFLEKLKGVHVLKKLKVLYMSNNQVKDAQEVDKLRDLTCLVEIVFIGNPLVDALGDDYSDTMTRKLPNLKKLDGVPVVRMEQEQEQQQE